MDPSARNVLTGTAARYALLLVNLVTGLALMPFTVHHLGTRGYGLWMLIASLLAYFQLLDLGYGAGLVRRIAQADARGDTEGINTALSTFLVVYSGIGLLAFAGALGVAIVLVPRFPGLTPDQLSTARAVTLILGVRVAVGFAMGVFGAVTAARQHFAINANVAIVVSLLQAAVTYAVLERGLGLVPLVAGTTAVHLASYAAYAAVARRIFPAMRLSLSRVRLREVREVTAFSIYLFLIGVVIQVGDHLDNLVVGAFLGTGAVAVYMVAFRLADYQRQLCNQFNGLLFPVAVRFDAAGHAGALRTTFVEGTRLALALVGALTVCLISFANPLVSAWMGPGFVEAIPPLYILATASVIIVGQGPLGNVLLAAGRHRLVGVTAGLEAAANVVLSVLLVRRFGLTGVALGTAVPLAMVNLGILLPTACRVTGVSTREILRASAAPALIAACPATLAAVILRLSLAAESLPAVAWQAAMVALVYLAALWMFGLRQEDRARYAGYARQLGTGVVNVRTQAT